MQPLTLVSGSSPTSTEQHAPQESSEAPPGEGTVGPEPPGECGPLRVFPGTHEHLFWGRPWPLDAHCPADMDSGEAGHAVSSVGRQWGQRPWERDQGQDAGPEAYRSGQSLEATGQPVPAEPPALPGMRAGQTLQSQESCLSWRAGQPLSCWAEGASVAFAGSSGLAIVVLPRAPEPAGEPPQPKSGRRGTANEFQEVSCEGPPNP